MKRIFGNGVLPVVLYLLVMLAITVLGRWQYYASRPLVQWEIPQHGPQYATVGFAEGITGGDGILTVRYDEDMYTIYPNVSCSVYHPYPDVQTNAIITEVSADSDGAYFAVSVELPDDNAEVSVYLSVPLPVSYTVPSEAIIDGGYVYVIAPSPGFFIDGFIAEKQAVEVLSVSESGRAVIRAASPNIQVIVPTGAETEDGMKVRLN